MNNYNNNIKIGFKIFIFTLKNIKTSLYEKIKKTYDKICDKICDLYIYVYSFSTNKKSEDEKIQIILSEFILKNSEIKTTNIENNIENNIEGNNIEEKETPVEVKQIHIQFYKLIQQILYKENREYNTNTNTGPEESNSEQEPESVQKYEVEVPGVEVPGVEVPEEIIMSSDGEYEIL